MLVFHINLVQDVAVLRPLIQLAMEFPEHEKLILLSPDFARFDAGEIWAPRLEAIAAEFEVPILRYQSVFEAYQTLDGKNGVIFAGSESDLPNHSAAHNLFRTCPRSFLTVTLQHGFECVGFLHSAAHDRTAGRNVQFAADVLVGWFAAERLTSVPVAMKSKLFIAGPPMLIDEPPASNQSAPVMQGMICENLHSVRFGSASSKASFMEAFDAFSARIAAVRSVVHLRSHPAGQTLAKRAGEFGSHVMLSNAPIYETDLTRFAFGISAPSSILFDLMLARVPVALWEDGAGWIDASNWSGLETVATVDDWWRFAARVTLDPTSILDRQSAFLSSLAMPRDVKARYASLMSRS